MQRYMDTHMDRYVGVHNALIEIENHSTGRCTVRDKSPVRARNVMI